MIALYSRYEQNTTKILHKYKVLHTIQTLRLSVGGCTDARTHGRTDGRTDRRTENIYSIFRDKLLLLGEHRLPIFEKKKSSASSIRIVSYCKYDMYFNKYNIYSIVGIDMEKELV